MDCFFCELWFLLIELIVVFFLSLEGILENLCNFIIIMVEEKEKWFFK